jgi:MarR family transcriptional regulator, organic hydroperoxide resistance regulator
MSSICTVAHKRNRKTRTLREEIRQTKPFASPAQEAILGLYRTADLLQRTFAQIVEPRDISLQQYNVLRILRGAGKQGIPTLDIADRMIEKTPGITRLLDKLEAKHLVRRERCPDDRRQVLCWITPRGLQLLADLDKPLTSAGEKVAQPLKSSELQTLIALMEKIRNHLSQSF